MTILITRPLIDATRLAGHLKEQGHKTILSPVLDIQPLDADLSVTDDAYALIFTSLNGVRHAEDRIAGRTHPVFTVGYRTAEAAREAGWSDITSADGDAVALADLILKQVDAKNGPLVHLCGQEHKESLAQTLKDAGFTIHSIPVYVARPVSHMTDEAKSAFQGGDISLVLLYSPRSAQQFRVQLKAAAMEHILSNIAAGCLSPAVAAKAGEGWDFKIVAQTPDENALFDALEKTCGGNFGQF